MWLNRQEQVALSVLGLVALLGLGVLFWQQQRPPLVIEGSPNPVQVSQWDEALASARQIDVNTADVAALERLPGIGPTLAQRIMEYREAHGPFSAPEELSNVKGVGPKTYETLRDYVTTRER